MRPTQNGHSTVDVVHRRHGHFGPAVCQINVAHRRVIDVLALLDINTRMQKPSKPLSDLFVWPQIGGMYSATEVVRDEATRIIPG